MANNRWNSAKAAAYLKRKVELLGREFLEQYQEYHRQKSREYRAKHRTKMRAASRAYNRRKSAETNIPWKYTPEKRARVIVRYAVQSGKLPKPDHCTQCGKVDLRHRIQAHHADHTKPLEVTWLCSICHGLETRKERERKRLGLVGSPPPMSSSIQQDA